MNEQHFSLWGAAWGRHLALALAFLALALALLALALLALALALHGVSDSVERQVGDLPYAPSK